MPAAHCDEYGVKNVAEAGARIADTLWRVHKIKATFIVVELACLLSKGS